MSVSNILRSSLYCLRRLIYFSNCSFSSSLYSFWIYRFWAITYSCLSFSFILFMSSSLLDKSSKSENWICLLEVVGFWSIWDSGSYTEWYSLLFPLTSIFLEFLLKWSSCGAITLIILLILASFFFEVFWDFFDADGGDLDASFFFLLYGLALFFLLAGVLLLLIVPFTTLEVCSKPF
jgi:hypothetical protein